MKLKINFKPMTFDVDTDWLKVVHKDQLFNRDTTYTDFEDYAADSDSSPANKVEAELEDIAAKLSVGYKF